MTTTKSRKERRAAASNGSTQPKPMTVDEIPLSRPDFARSTESTLYDFAAKKEAELRKQIPAYEAKKRAQANAEARNTTAEPPPTDEDQNVNAVVTALMYGLSLTTLHLTLDILTWHQYAQLIVWSRLVKRNIFVTLPASVFLIYVFHAPFFGLVKLPKWAQQVIFFSAAVGAGLYAVWLSNEGAYLAVMKKVPPAVTVVMWAVLEMDLLQSLASVAAIGAGTWWQGWQVY